jgi:hypothetical protein
MHATIQRRHFLALAGLGLGMSTPAFAQGDLNEAINKAGRQRMLSQRMSKAWLALGQQIEPSRAERILSDSIALFDRQLSELKVSAAPTAELRGTYAKLDASWSDFRALLLSPPPQQATASSLLALDSQVLSLSNQVTQQLEQFSGKPVGQLVNVAGRQRMLSQRIAKYHLAMTWKTAGADASQQIDSAKHEFSAALDVLAKAPQTTPAIQQQIALARQQWMLFESAMGRVDAPAKRDAENLFVASENLLQVMDQITGLYARLGA